jgi:hypothetical protein
MVPRISERNRRASDHAFGAQPTVTGARGRSDRPDGKEEGSQIMKLTYAVDRLFDTGWTPSEEADLDRLPDGRRFPSVLAVQREFARAGLELSIKHNMVFNCFRSTWRPIGHPLNSAHAADERHGTVIGACEREAAVYALAQLREAQAERQLATV